MRNCESCECPTAPTRETCPFCGAALDRPEPVAFSLERGANLFQWFTDGALVASAAPVNGVWQIADARGSHVVTLVPLGDDPTIDGTALVGPKARLLGALRPHDDGAAAGCVATDPDGRPVLVLRTDGNHAAHLVDRRGDVVCVASWEDTEAVTDLLVTPHGTKQSLAMVFGVLLSLEVTRQTRRPA